MKFDKLKGALIFVFGANPKVRFHRIIYTLALIALFIIMFLNVSCGIDKKGNWYFKWQPGATISITK